MTQTMTSPIPQTQDDLQIGLASFEHSLEVPIVPGELEAWFNTAKDACLKLDPVLRKRVRRDYAPMLKALGEQDPELLTQVQQMSAESDALLDGHLALCALAERWATSAHKIGSEEARLNEQVQTFVQQGLDFIIRVRKQEAALATWYHEGFNRDLGVGG